MVARKITGIFTIFLMAGVLAVVGCNSSSDDDPVPSVTELSTYAEDVQACTPYLAESFIDEWSGWDPTGQINPFSVIYKMFSDNGVESIYAGVDAVDSFVEIINAVSDLWNSDGVHEDVALLGGDDDEEEEGDEGDAGEGVTITVDTSVTSVDIPFFGNTVSVDRAIQVVIPQAEGNMTMDIAFTLDAEQETIVAREDGADLLVFYGTRDNSTGDIELWYACDGAAFKWMGNPDEGWFAISQHTDAATDWKVMGGGEVDGEVAFIADIVEVDMTAGEYYISTTMDNIEDPDCVPVDITDASLTAPSGEGVLAYISAGEDSCIGYIESYPTSEEDLAWSLD